MKAYGYVRVSTREQDEEVQKHEIEEYAKRNGMEIVEWFIDKGISGNRPFKDRPEANRLLERLKFEKVDAIIVYAIDRIGRGMLDTIQTITEFENNGIKVISVKETFMQTLDENIRRLILSILAWVSEFERKRIRERQISAWESGKQKGRPAEITKDEIMSVYKQYPNASYRVLHAIINERRRQRGKKPISYSGLIKAMKRYGLVKKIVKEGD